MEDVYEITYDTCGQYWPKIHHYIFLSVTLMQITMIGLFGLKSKPGASFATIPLLVFNILFNEYTARSDFSQLSTIDRSRYICFHGSSLLKFGASIKHEVQIVITNLEIYFGYRHKVSKESDELAEEGTTGNLDDAISAYKPTMDASNEPGILFWTAFECLICFT